jgi:hypothetical protein
VHALRVSLIEAAGFNIMNESTIERGQTEDEVFFDEIPDEAVEAAASGPGENITFTISINVFYCRFC